MIPIDQLLGRRQPAPDFADPIAFLVHCHRRIEWRLALLERAGDRLRAGDRAALPEVFAAVDGAVHHFATAGVRHTEDEELSLFPRLEARGGAAGREALEAVRALEVEHRSAEALHAAFDALVARMPRDGSAGSAEVERFCALVAELSALYRPHIQVEDRDLFPVAARVLAPDDLQAIGAEMRARRPVAS